MNFTRLSPFADAGLLRVVIETPKDSRNKLDYDPELRAFHLKKTLPEGMVFPYDFGFSPQTLGEDGDPLDVLVLMPESVAPGCVLEGRLIGVIRALQKAKGGKTIRNDRFLVVSATALEFARIKGIGDLPPMMLGQLEQFFVTYNALEGRKFKFEGVEGPKAALKLIKRSYRAVRRRGK